MSYGLTAQGFNPKPLSALLTSMQTVQLAEISTSLDVQPDALMGVLNGIVAAALSELWQLGLALYTGMDPAQATNDALVNLALLTGTVRENATKTQVLACTVNVGAGFSAAPGTMFAHVVSNPVALFTNKATVSNPGGSPANETADFIAVNAGPIQCLSGTLTVIATPLTGWNTITNPTDGIVGANIETDAALRLRREQELAASGQSTADAIRAAVLEKMITPTTSSNTVNCAVLHNDTDATDVNGLPPHSVEVIAYQPGNTGADDTALANLILNSKGAGIGTHGASATNATDSQGNVESIAFTRPTALNIYIAITVLTDPKTFPANGATLIQNALLAYGALEYSPGATAYAKATQATVFPNPADPFAGVPGVLDVTVFKLDTITPPVATGNLAVGVRQIALLDSSRIVVTVT